MRCSLAIQTLLHGSLLAQSEAAAWSKVAMRVPETRCRSSKLVAATVSYRERGMKPVSSRYATSRDANSLKTKLEGAHVGYDGVEYRLSEYNVLVYR